MVRPTDPFPTDDAGAEESTWPPFVPHREIDQLVDRLESGLAVDPGEAFRLLGLIAKEAQRLRTLVLRLSSAKLSEADREARAIVAEALRQADAMRSAGLEALEARLDEADEVIATMREAFRTELRAAEVAQAVGVTPLRPDARTRSGTGPDGGS
ncbi:hypothetical protein JK386_06330 [Nocardioides sp. zg-536]|uniref:Uncharacterized protein n=1 Tax=Nocardioides faecalis TaxID=2803858 RepID=A0A938Y3V5_9ACTN|nr:hypothetical protein [Nocardioides faecalis]MBM9459513.1 hypothetical protein [Nocardioides faecalis]MBS4753707.1 hypothetical protein [Nocardioides faecalis]QVI58050.1 hypothetical protein KG111_13625 [Nocardioides faecalis]